MTFSKLKLLLLGTSAALSGGLYAAPAQAQAAASAYTSGYRWDSVRRLVGQISPDPDLAGPLTFAAVRYTYDLDGQLVRTEKGKLAAWQAETVLPSAWSGFAVLETIDYTYDVIGNRIQEKLTTAAGGATVQTVTQMSYDGNDRLLCSAVRMDMAAIPAAGSDACIAGTPGTQGPDRITRSVYDAAGQTLQVRKAVGTSIEQAYVTYGYTLNGKQEYVVDANGNRARLAYDGFDRQSDWYLPAAALPAAFNPATPATALATAGSASTTDYEHYGYDANGNRTSLKKRDGQTIAYGYDALDRMQSKDLPGTAADVTYGYDLVGHLLTTKFTASSLGVTNTYDKADRLGSSTNTTGGTSRALQYAYDANGNRTRITHPDTSYFTYDYDGLNRVQSILENQTVAPNGILASIVYDDLGRRSLMSRGSGTSLIAPTTYGYETGSRLGCLAHDLVGGGSPACAAGTASTPDFLARFVYNPASQITSRTLASDAYVSTTNANLDRPYTTNGLNQYTQTGVAGAITASYQYDLNGNLTVSATAEGTITFAYDTENRLTGASGGSTATLVYDPLGRLYETSGGSAGVTRFLYDGDALVAEYDAAGTLLRRYVHGPGVDEPLVWYEGAAVGAASRRYLYADHQGSVVAVASGAGALLQANGYDPYGLGNATNLGRFRYTGQIHIPELDLYYYKARIYAPRLGRFLQTDPIGYDDQVNLYAYVGNDPVNWRDPSGMCSKNDAWADCEIKVTAETKAVNIPSLNGPPPLKPEQARYSNSTKLQNRTPAKPAYCSSFGYKIGDFVDSTLGGGAQTVGTGTVIAGGAVGLATAITGVGVGAGGAIAGVGGVIYAGGSALSAVGNGIKFLSGQSGAVSVGSLFGIPAARLGPASQIAANSTVSYFVGKAVPNPCN